VLRLGKGNVTLTARGKKFRFGSLGDTGAMGFLMWLLAVILVVGGAVQLVQGQILFGIVLIIVGLGVGPGGFSFFRSRETAGHR
jgi:hypothetical protein